METTFTPWASLAGGGLIGLAAVALMLLHGRILGATGILGGLLRPGNAADWSWRAALVAGMIAAPLAFTLATGTAPALQVPVGPGLLVVGGVIVGIGATLGAGCPSGHGVCGIARLSPRSIVATATFLLTCAITVYVLRHVVGV